MFIHLHKTETQARKKCYQAIKKSLEILILLISVKYDCNMSNTFKFYQHRKLYGHISSGCLMISITQAPL
jgi:hypothetical protein